MIPLLVHSQTTQPDSAKTETAPRFLYDLGISIEPKRESVTPDGKGVAYQDWTAIQSQIDSLSSAFRMWRAQTEAAVKQLRTQIDSLARIIDHQLARESFPPLPAPATPLPVYSKSEGEELFEKGLGAYRRGNYQIAVDYLMRAINSPLSGARTGEAFLYIGESHIRLDNELLGLACLHRVAEYPMAGKTEEALLSIGRIYAKMGQTKWALEIFHRIIRRKPASDLARQAEKEIFRLHPGQSGKTEQ